MSGVSSLHTEIFIHLEIIVMPFFQTNDVNLFYTVQGTGRPILLLHGYACDSHDWSFQIPFLVSRNYKVIALDQRGHGRSSSPPHISSYSLRAFADDAAALLNHLAVGKAIVIGHSIGTVIASILAVEHPEWVHALVVVHPIYSGVPDALPKLVLDMFQDLPNAPELAEKFFADYMYTLQTPEWLRTWTLRRVLGMGPVALLGSLQALVDTFGSVMGQTEEAEAYMRRRGGPRLAVCTLPAAPGWEEEVGTQGSWRLEVKTLTAGTFSHLVESEAFNQILGDWLKAEGL